jgi:hypothetical protein
MEKVVTFATPKGRKKKAETLSEREGKKLAARLTKREKEAEAISADNDEELRRVKPPRL